jgi:PKD domain
MRIRALILSLAIGAALPASAAGAGWVTGPPVSPAGKQVAGPLVGITRAGTRIVAWVQFTRSGVEGVAVRVAPPGGDFGPTQLLEDANAQDATLAVGDDGTAALVWESPGASTDVIRLARLAPGGTTFSAAAPFPLGAELDDPPLAAVANGTVYVAFDTRTRQNNTFTSAIQVLRLAPGTSAAQLVNGSAGPSLDQATFTEGAQADVELDQPTIAIQAGTVHVLWEHAQQGFQGGTATTEVRHASAALDAASFTAPSPVATLTSQSSSAPVTSPRLAQGAGKVDAIWRDSDQGALAFRDVSGGAVQRIVTGAFVDDVHGAIDPAGTLLLAWDQVIAAEGTQGVFTASIPDGSQPTRLTPPNANRALDDFALGPDGTALVVPDRLNRFGTIETDVQVEASVRVAGGAFGGLERVSGPQDHAEAGEGDRASGAVGADGRALIAWTADDGSGTGNERVFLSERDTTPPTIGSLTVPATAQTGVAATMSAVAADSQSPVSVHWDFGDGSGAAGSTVRHTYGAQGRFTVTISARDDAGNVTTQARSIEVRAAADSTPPVITRLSVTHARWRVGKARTALLAARRKQTPTGTTFKLNVSERSTLVLALSATARGRKAPAGTIIRSGRGPGAVSVAFSGRVQGAPLKPGTYSASVVAVDGAGKRSRARTVKFTVVSR